MTCPNCGGSEIRESRHSCSMDVFHRMQGEHPVRCRKCRQRFYTAESLTGREGAEKPARSAQASSRRHKSTRRSGHLMRVMVTVAVFGVMFLIFFAFLRFLSNEHSGEDNSASQSKSAPSAVQLLPQQMPC